MCQIFNHVSVFVQMRMDWRFEPAEMKGARRLIVAYILLNLHTYSFPISLGKLARVIYSLIYLINHFNTYWILSTQTQRRITGPSCPYKPD